MDGDQGTGLEAAPSEGASQHLDERPRREEPETTFSQPAIDEVSVPRVCQPGAVVKETWPRDQDPYSGNLERVRVKVISLELVRSKPSRAVAVSPTFWKVLRALNVSCSAEWLLGGSGSDGPLVSILSRSAIGRCVSDEMKAMPRPDVRHQSFTPNV